MEQLELLRYYPIMCGVLAIAFFLGKLLSYFSCKLRGMGIRPRPAEIGPFSRGEFWAYLFDVFYYPLLFVFVGDPDENNFSRLLALLVIGIGFKISDFIMRKVDGY